MLLSERTILKAAEMMTPAGTILKMCIKPQQTAEMNTFRCSFRSGGAPQEQQQDKAPDNMDDVENAQYQ